MPEDEFFKEGTLTEEELKKFEEEEEEIPVEEGSKGLIDSIYGGEPVEKEYIVVDVQRLLPERSKYVKKIDLYVLGDEEPITISIDHPKLKEIIEVIENFKLAKIKVKQLKVKVMIDGEIKESVTRDIEDIISIEEVDPLQYFKEHNIRKGIVYLRQGKNSPYLREDGVVKLVVSGYTINGMRLNASLKRDMLTKVLLVPVIVRRRGETTIVVGCWFMLKRKEGEKKEEGIEEEVEKIVQEVSSDLPDQIEV